MQSWRLTADVDRVALDLTFDALTPAVGVDGQGRSGSGASAATGAIVGKGHLEQAGRWSGWIDVEGTRHELVDARGNRDKSWGPRRWGAPKMWRWFSINIGDDTHFGGIRIGTDAGDLPHPGWAAEARARVHSDAESFAATVRAGGLRLHPGAIAYFARWVTPEELPKRYDTRFYAAAMPAGQEAVAAVGEVESLEWITPAAALERADTNEAYTLPPTRAALTSLAEFPDVAGALVGLPAGRDLTPILPRIVSGVGPSPEIRVVLPGEPGYELDAGG